MKEQKWSLTRYLLMLAIALVMMVSVKSVAFAEGEKLYIKGAEIANPATNDALDTENTIPQWTYNHKTKTLTLNNFSYTGGTEFGISVVDMDLNIYLQGNNTIDTMAKVGLYTVRSSISIEGNGILSCTGVRRGIECDGKLSIYNVDVKALSKDDHVDGGKYGIYVYDTVWIENAKVTAIGGTAYGIQDSMGIYCNGTPVFIENSEVTAIAKECTGTGDSIGMFTNDLSVNENSKLTLSGYKYAINRTPVRNHLAGTGWKDVNGTGVAELINAVPLGSQGQSDLDIYKKIQFPMVEAKITKLPTVKDLTYTGAAQELINAGSATNGEMRYAIGTSATAFPPESAFTAAIPMGTEVGDYYVWYKLADNTAYSGSTTPKCLTVKIKAIEYSVNITNDGNGTATASVTKGAKGTEVTLTATPNSGYHFKAWQVVKGGVTVSGNKFTIGTGDVEVKAIFEKDQVKEEKPVQSNDNQPEQQKPSEQAQSSQDADQIHTAPETAEAQPAETVDKKQKGTTISKVKAGKKSITVTWKKQTAKGIKGYEIQYSTDKKFTKDVKTVTVNKAKTTSKTIKKLTPKKKYYVRIRTFKKSGKEKIYSKWSKSKNVKVK